MIKSRFKDDVWWCLMMLDDVWRCLMFIFIVSRKSRFRILFQHQFNTLLMFHNHRYQDSKDVWTDWGCFQKRCSSSSNHDSISCLGEDRKITSNHCITNTSVHGRSRSSVVIMFTSECMLQAVRTRPQRNLLACLSQKGKQPLRQTTKNENELRMRRIFQPKHGSSHIEPHKVGKAVGHPKHELKKLSRAKHSTVQGSLPVSQQYWAGSEAWWNRCRHRGFFGHHEAWWGWDTKMWLDHHRSSKFLGDCYLWQTPVLSVPSCSLVLWQEALHTSSATMCWTLGTDLRSKMPGLWGISEKNSHPFKILWIDSIIFHLYSWWKRSWRKFSSALSSSGISGKTSDIASVEVRTPERQSPGKKTTIPYTKSCFSCTSVSLVGCFGWRIGHG